MTLNHKDIAQEYLNLCHDSGLGDKESVEVSIKIVCQKAKEYSATPLHTLYQRALAYLNDLNGTPSSDQLKNVLR